MLAHLRLFFSAVVILAGVSTSPAYSNPIAGQPDSKLTTERAAALVASQETCLSQPGKSTIAGQRWVYYRDGQRKCWFQTTEQPQSKNRVRDRAAKASVSASAESDGILPTPKPKRVDDARAELRLETPQALPSASGLDVVAAAPVQRADQASLLIGELDRQESDKLAGRQPDADSSPTRVPLQKVVSHAPLIAATPAVHSTSEALDDKPGSPATWIAVLLMTLGFSSILGSNRAVRDLMMLRYKGAQV